MAARKTRKSTRWTVAPRRTFSSRAPRMWTREEMAFMRKYYRNYETAWIARQLGRTVYAVRYKAVDLSIKKASPSVWRGNRGNVNAFRKPTTRSSRTPARHNVSSRRNTRSYHAGSTRQTTRRVTRRNRRQVMR